MLGEVMLVVNDRYTLGASAWTQVGPNVTWISRDHALNLDEAMTPDQP
jgi:hypothetical protein